MTLYYQSRKDRKDAEINLICRIISNDVQNYNEDLFSISELEFRTGRSPATIRQIIDIELPKRGYELSYEAAPEMCTPDLDEEIQIPDQHIRIYARLVKG